MGVLCIEFTIANVKLNDTVKEFNVMEPFEGKPVMTRLFPFSLLFIYLSLFGEIISVCVHIKCLVMSCKSRDNTREMFSLSQLTHRPPSFISRTLDPLLQPHTEDSIENGMQNQKHVFFSMKMLTLDCN